MGLLSFVGRLLGVSESRGAKSERKQYMADTAAERSNTQALAAKKESEVADKKKKAEKGRIKSLRVKSKRPLGGMDRESNKLGGKDLLG